MKISVIIPTYKPSDYLWECLNSIKVQSLCNCDYEVIIVLNGCNEPYNSQIREYIDSQLSDHIVRLVQTDLSGVSNARNIALDLSRGEYITFIDDDDYVSPDYLSELLRLSSLDTIALCYPLAFIDGSTDTFSYSITHQYDSIAALGTLSYNKARKFFSGPVYKLIHRDIIGNRRFDSRFSNGEDSLFMFLISDKFRFVECTSTKAVYYRRIREGSATVNPDYRRNIISNRFSLVKEYTIIFFSNISAYNFCFYITRVLAAIKVVIKYLLHK